MFTANLPIRNDPWYIICERAMEDKRYERVRDQIIRGNRTIDEGRGYFNMDGPLYHDTRQQAILTAAQSSVTGATTDKMIVPAQTCALPAMYFATPKKVRLTVWVAVTTGTTPGNTGIELYYGTTDAGTTAIVSSTVAAFVGTQTSQVMWIQFYATARGGAVPTATPVIGFGQWLAPTALCTAANQQGSNPIPLATPAATNVDATSTTGGLHIQMKNSGANANSYVTHDLTFEALN